MSFEAVNIVIKKAPVKGQDFACLLALAHYVRRGLDNCWPSVESLANTAHISPRGIHTSLRSLEKTKWVVTKRGEGVGYKAGQKSSKYTIDIERMKALPDYEYKPTSNPNMSRSKKPTTAKVADLKTAKVAVLSSSKTAKVAGTMTATLQMKTAKVADKQGKEQGKENKVLIAPQCNTNSLPSKALPSQDVNPQQPEKERSGFQPPNSHDCEKAIALLDASECATEGERTIVDIDEDGNEKMPPTPKKVRQKGTKPTKAKKKVELMPDGSTFKFDKYAVAWTDAYGGKMRHISYVAGDFKEWEIKHGLVVMLESWQRYLADTTAKYASGGQFLSIIGEYLPPELAPPKPTSPPEKPNPWNDKKYN